MNIAQILSEKARILGPKTAIRINRQERSFADLDRQVTKAAAVLKDLNIGKGDRVAFLLPKGLAFIELYLATLGLGAIALPLNPAYRPEEILYFLSDSESSLVIIHSEKQVEIGPVLNQIPSLQILVIDREVPKTYYYPRLLQETMAGAKPFYPTRGEDVALLCYTSGTTGRSKGAMITHENLIENMKALNQAWRWTDQDILLHVLPLFHIHGLTVALHGGLFAGSTLIMRERFDPLETWRILEQERCTMLMAVPTIYQRLSLAWDALERKPNLETVRVFISGSAPLPEPLFHRFKKQTGHTLLERYGMTEAGMIASNPYDSELRKVKSVGYPLSRVAVRIVGKEGQEVIPGEVGEVWIKGNNVFKGYWNQPEKTAESFEEGWFKSGDLGYQDPEDHLRLYLAGRARELIITGGYNVYPKEIENILEDHAAVQEAAVFGLAHEDFGEEVVAAVVLREGRTLAAGELIDFCKIRLVGYKCPHKIFLRSALPHNTMGKLQKHLLQKEVLAMSDNDYQALREFLHQFPRGFLKTETGVEIKILKKLFTEEEARITVRLSTLPEELEKIAERLDRKADELGKQLDAMARRGLIFRFQRQGSPFYRAAPFMIGLYEYSVKKIDKELAALFKEYYEAAYIKELGNHNIPGFKVIPMEKNIDTQMVLLPYQRLEESVRAARKIAVADCVCRKEAALLGEGCDHPVESCLSFGVAAEYYIDSGLGREITADEAVKILKEADESGLIHAGANSRHLSNICNCCSCCCAGLKAITKFGSYRQRHFNAVFEAVVDAEGCTACEACLDRCPVKAIEVGDTVLVDRDKCLGCGLCATTCPTESIRLLLRADRKEPFDNVGDLGSRVLAAKGKAPLMVKQKEA